MTNIKRFMRAFAAAKRGATAIEYGLIASLVAVLMIGGLQLTKDAMYAMYLFIAGAIQSVM